jgi:hypothetical protein
MSGLFGKHQHQENKEGNKTANYRLKVTAGPEYDVKTHQIVPVNSPITVRFENEQATVNICVRIQGYTGNTLSSVCFHMYHLRTLASPPLPKRDTIAKANSM